MYINNAYWIEKKYLFNSSHKIILYFKNSLKISELNLLFKRSNALYQTFANFLIYYNINAHYISRIV